MESTIKAVSLRRKVCNPDTNLLEWRRCACRITHDGRLVLEEPPEEQDEDQVTESEADRVLLEIDLGWQLVEMQQSRKNKTRVALEFYADRDSIETLHEELMAPSAKHCQQWINSVCAGQAQAQRLHSMRAGSIAAVAANASAIGSESSPANGPSLGSSFLAESSPSRLGAAPEMTRTSQSSRVSPLKRLIESGRESSTDASALLSSSVFDESTGDKSWHQHQQIRAPNEVESLNAISSEPPEPTARRVTATPASSCTISSSNSDRSRLSSPSSVSTSAPTRELRSVPVPAHVFSRQLAALRAQRRSAMSNDDDDDDDDSSLGGLDESPRRQPRRSACAVGRRSSALNCSSYAPRTRSNQDRELLGQSTRHRRGNNSHSHSASFSSTSMAATLSRVRLRDRTAFADDEDEDEELLLSNQLSTTGSHAELHILRRVEGALRQLEKENVMARDREMALSQEVQALRDTLRLRSAEKKHLEKEFQQLLREKEQWQNAAHRAESGMAQMEQELQIAREEAQLLSSEKLRLKHQNKELLTHVHRLDSLVYGRF